MYRWSSHIFQQTKVSCIMKTLKCSTCQEEKPLSNFGRDRSYVRGFDYRCRECKSRWKRTETGKESSHRYKVSEKGRAAQKRNRKTGIVGRRANKAVSRALKSGQMIKPENCARCGKPGTLDGHHGNGYEGPARRDVEWLCTDCHNAEHHPAVRGYLPKLIA